MKRKILIIALALLLCFSLCACGSYRASYDDDYGVTDNGTARNGMTGNGVNDSGTNRNGTADNGMNGSTDAMPDAEDGYVDDNNADDGVIDGNLPSPSPNMTNKR